MNRLLVVVDYQNDGVLGSLGFPQAVQIEDAISEKIRDYKSHGGDVAFTLDTHYGEKFEAGQIKSSPWGWQLYGKIASLCSENDRMISKHTCASLDLLEFLIAGQYDSVELCGIVTNICVLANAVIAKTALPEAEIIVDAGCVASDDMALHEQALNVMAGMKITLLNRKV